MHVHTTNHLQIQNTNRCIMQMHRHIYIYIYVYMYVYMYTHTSSTCVNTQAPDWIPKCPQVCRAFLAVAFPAFPLCGAAARRAPAALRAPSCFGRCGEPWRRLLGWARARAPRTLVQVKGRWVRHRDVVGVSMSGLVVLRTLSP